MKKLSLLLAAMTVVIVAGCYKVTTPTTVPTTIPSTTGTTTTPTDTTTTPTGTTTTPTTKPTPAPKITIQKVSIANFKFSPASVTINKGSTVTWTNNDSAPHQVYADDGSFQGPIVQPGDSYSYTFKTAGTYGYHCNIHTYMKGTVVVK